LIHNFIAIEGNIGSGKTTLSGKIASKYNARLMLEEFEENPFLKLFYKNPEKYSFQLELSFLADRFRQVNHFFSKPDIFNPLVVSDYFISKCLVFARINLPEEEFKLYHKLFSVIYNSLPKPDLTVFLYQDIEQLKKNISKRGRTYESDISSGYLHKIQEGYLDFYRQQENMRVLLLDTRGIDFVEDITMLNKIYDIINCDYTTGIHKIRLNTN
jgi:deoxyguanosine kinase